jgi:Rad3-related DNA helicase
MNKVKLPMMISLVSLLLIGCAGAEAPLASYERASDAGMPVVEQAVADIGDVDSATAWSDASGEIEQIEPLVIRNANLSLVVEDPAESADEIASMAETMGGFVVSSNIYQTTYGTSQASTTRASITIRVPADRLDEALDEIVEDAIEVREKNISGQDVTQEYTDLQSRLRNLEAAEEQLREIMASTTKTEDVLEVFNDLRQTLHAFPQFTST